MQKLTNTEQDRNALYTLLATGVKPRATFGLGCFTSELASSLEIVNYDGVITEIDSESGYCNWENMQGDMMPSVNINVITLDKRLQLTSVAYVQWRRSVATFRPSTQEPLHICRVVACVS